MEQMTALQDILWPVYLKVSAISIHAEIVKMGTCTTSKLQIVKVRDVGLLRLFTGLADLNHWFKLRFKSVDFFF